MKNIEKKDFISTSHTAIVIKITISVCAVLIKSPSPIIIRTESETKRMRYCRLTSNTNFHPGRK